ncbi:MAG: hypothetical protein ACQGVK_17235 [Myxococcota bacterium]
MDVTIVRQKPTMRAFPGLPGWLVDCVSVKRTVAFADASGSCGAVIADPNRVHTRSEEGCFSTVEARRP